MDGCYRTLSIPLIQPARMENAAWDPVHGWVKSSRKLRFSRLTPPFPARHEYCNSRKDVLFALFLAV